MVRQQDLAYRPSNDPLDTDGVRNRKLAERHEHATEPQAHLKHPKAQHSHTHVFEENVRNKVMGSIQTCQQPVDGDVQGIEDEQSTKVVLGYTVPIAHQMTPKVVPGVEAHQHVKVPENPRFTV